MNIDFHYTRMAKIAAAAGMPESDIRRFAYACQYTDDNDQLFSVKRHDGSFFRNRISQTLSVFSVGDTRAAVYPLFHFLPGDAGSESPRKDGKTHPLCVTPGSSLCGRVMDEALRTGDIYRIGIAAHACADSWAHQNFVGAWHGFNSTGNTWRPNIGHADVYGMPDMRGLVWDDPRLADPACDNVERFAAAEAWLLGKLNAGGTVLPDARYFDVPPYDPREWFDTAVKTTVARVGMGKTEVDRRRYEFREDCEDSDWYRFQSAVTAHADFVEACIKEMGLT